MDVTQQKNATGIVRIKAAANFVKMTRNVKINQKTSNMQYEKKNPESIQKMFASIAERYDFTNSLLSFNMHKYWNRQLVNKASEANHSSNFLDLCSGTGDIAFGLMKKRNQPCNMIFLDFCPEMLAFAKKKSEIQHSNIPHEMSFIQGDAQEIPLDDASVDCVTVAYGIRNVKDPARCIKEAYRVLNKGGVFGILELTQPSNSFLKLGHTVYLKTLMPLLGKLVTTNKGAYDYLCSSIHNFVSPDELGKTLHEANFSNITKIPLMGGIATIIIAKK